MNPFTHRYKTFSYPDLIRIVENPDEYQPEAIEAARQEIDRREIPDTEREAAQSALESERREALRKIEKRTRRTNKWKGAILSVIDLVNPIQQDAPTTARLIRLLTLSFVIATIYTWVRTYGLIWFLLFGDMGDVYTAALFYISDILALYPAILLPVITVLLSLRKKWGWILAASQMLLLILDKLSVLYVLWSMDTSDSPWMGNPLLEGFVPQLLAILYGVGMFWILSRKGVMVAFKLDRQAVYISIGIVVAMEAFLFGMMI